MQRRHVNDVNVLRSKYCILNHRCEQTCTKSDRRVSAGTIPAVRAVRSVKSGEADAWRRGRRVVSPCIHAGSNHAAFRWLSQVGRIVTGSFQDIVPRKTAENTVRFDGSQPPRCLWKFGGRSNTTVFDNIDIGDLPMPIRRCFSRLRCYRFSMSDVYIGRTLLKFFQIILF